MIFKLGVWETLWQSHLLAGVPIQSWPLQDEPETLPLLGDEDTALFSLLPQPSITVGHAQLAARHAASTHGRCHSCKDQIAEITLYRDKQRFYWRQKKCATAWCFNQARTLMHGRQLQELFWGSVSCSWTLVVCRGLGLNYWKLFYNNLLNNFAETATPILVQPAQSQKQLGAMTKRQLHINSVVALWCSKSLIKQTFQRGLLSVFLPLKIERKAALFQFVAEASSCEVNSLSGFHSWFNFSSSLTICPTISGQELMLAVSGLISWGEGLLRGWKGDGLLDDGDLSSPGLGESLKRSNSPGGIKSGSCTVHRTGQRKLALHSLTWGWQRRQPPLVILVWRKGQTSLCILVQGQLWLFLSHRLLLCLWPVNRSPVVESRY